MAEQHEEEKELGEITCPNCKHHIEVKKVVTYNRKEKRKKISEELVAVAVQLTLPPE